MVYGYKKGDFMKKNGFTLFEIIVVIGIAAGFLSIFLVNFSAENKRINKRQMDTVKEQVMDAAETFVAVNKDNSDTKYDNLRKVINNQCGCLKITINTLEEEGFIVENVVPNSFKNKYDGIYFGYNACNGRKYFEYNFGNCSCWISTPPNCNLYTV